MTEQQERFLDFAEKTARVLMLAFIWALGIFFAVMLAPLWIPAALFVLAYERITGKQVST